MPERPDNTGPDPTSRHDAYPRYAEGVCDVICEFAVTYPDPRFRCRGTDGKVRATWKCRLDCVRVSDQAPICGFLNLGNECGPDVRLGSKYRRVWIMANGVAPRKRQQMSKRMFVGKVFRVKVGDTRRDYQGNGHPEGAVYSTIKEFIACTGP